ncbi:MAG: carboxypeptidase-like regulatory domain-containing protein [Bacteroidales bacterium]|nr:carboxypeptidase-like regulatory domain-containing protein [Bacteroidales bacterium]MCB9013755.1 carboxypeptidase-like regulatory domain-containing protein [Bacteroidales bacterium]
MNSALKLIFTILILSSLSPLLLGQSRIYGTVNDQDGQAVFLANVAVKGYKSGTMTNPNGQYELKLNESGKLTIVVSCIGYSAREINIENFPDSSMEINFVLETNVSEIDEVSISARQERASAFSRIDLKDMQLIPTTSDGIESLIKTLPGVSSNNELSSQYTVRGGNFDENLIYVNDIEIYRPFLVRSGQQEGLSFINSDLVSSIRFSAGGFDANYGDKMSSVLDITYRKPREFAGSVSASLLGGSVHLEGSDKSGRFTFLSGMRYKTTSYLLNSLETAGDYSPKFSDVQGLFTYSLSSKSEISFLANAAINQYNFVPSKRTTEFGTTSTPLNLVIYYEGQEKDRFDTYMGALTYKYSISPKTWMKVIGSGFHTSESESFDILGEYLINELDNTIGSKTYGDSILNIGIGGFLNHARNYLDAYVYSINYVGEYSGQVHKIKWGLGYQFNNISDKLSEWEMVDSTGFSVPADGSSLELSSVLKSENTVLSGKYSAYLQDTWGFRGISNEYYLTLGLRSTYLDLNGQFLLSPRMNFSLKPQWEKDIMFHFSGGVYFQPPFYREMRDPYGKLNTDLKAQRAVHIVAGGDYIFQAWERPFKLTTELYYKNLANLVPYKVDNVRIKYAGENLAKGYAVGIDFKLNGEFVKNAESWVSLSLLQTKEDIINDFYYEVVNGVSRKVEPGFYSRPTDQLFNFGLYFQDYFPNNPDYKVHLNFLYGSRLPYSSPGTDRYDNLYRIPAYRRVDIGFSKILKKEDTMLSEKNPFRHFTNIWISAEIFNLLDINNTISYLWVRTISNQQNVPGVFAVPNYLTSRRFNVKLTARF